MSETEVHIANVIGSITRAIITLMVSATFCYGFTVKLIDDGVFSQTVSMILAFWFGSMMASRMTRPATADTSTNGGAK